MLDRVPRIKPTHVVQIGDLFDFYSFSRFPSSLNVSTPHKEVREGRWMAEEMWAEIHKLAPTAQCFQSLGNHEERPWKLMLRAAPALEELLRQPLLDLLRFPGVTTMGSPLDELEINGVRFIHGWSTTPGFHVRKLLTNIAHGHTHKGGVVPHRIHDRTLWELDAGILANYNALPLLYRQTKTCDWTPGYGVIDGMGPRFCPL